MHRESVDRLLSTEQRTIVDAVRNHSAALLDHSPRFRYFTLHGSMHINNLFRIINVLIDSGLKLSQDQAFLLACAVCVHDVGMVVPLQAMEPRDLFQGRPQPADPANLELQIRAMHHELVDKSVNCHLDFLTSLGLSASDCAIIRDISRCHRKIDLDSTEGYVRSIGALLRLVDELDIGPSRAPSAVLMEGYTEMDATSCWYWFKHNICEEWRPGHNVLSQANEVVRITFKLSVHPPRVSSIPYWLTQVRRPISRVLHDEGVARIIAETWGMQVSATSSQELSSALLGSPTWEIIEQKALSAGRKVILVIDDEVRKMEDLFLPLMQHFHVLFSPNAKDALDKLAAAKIDLAIIDLQVGSGFQWSAEETGNYKMTGIRLCKEIQARFPNTRTGILTGSRYDLSEVYSLSDLAFVLRKPVDPDQFEKEVSRVLS